MVYEDDKKKVSFMRRLGNKYKAYKAKEPERRADRMTKLQENLKMQEVREKIAKSKMRVQSQQLRIQSSKKKSMGEMPSMMGSFGGMGTLKKKKHKNPPLMW